MESGEATAAELPYVWLEVRSRRAKKLALNASAPEAAIVRSERDLGGSFPPSYRMFLTRWNGAMLADGTRILGVYDAERPSTLGDDIVRANGTDTRFDELGDEMLIFAVTRRGAVFCFDTGGDAEVSFNVSLEPGSGPRAILETTRLAGAGYPSRELGVSRFDPFREKSKKTHASFAEWLHASVLGL